MREARTLPNGSRRIAPISHACPASRTGKASISGSIPALFLSTTFDPISAVFSLPVREVLRLSRVRVIPGGFVGKGDQVSYDSALISFGISSDGWALVGAAARSGNSSASFASVLVASGWSSP
jgi:hypothetical protein